MRELARESADAAAGQAGAAAGRYVLGLDEIDARRVALVGGKGANLGELARIEGVGVPPGFCVTTGAFERIIAAAPETGELLGRLSRADTGDRGAIAARIRRAIEETAVPADLADAITGAVDGQGEYAVRSSATAEDLPGASFAGQQDSYLNVTGPAAVLAHVRRCWASLFTERSVAYRARNNVDHRGVAMAVVVQRMVIPRAAGVAFTADPVTSDRKVVAIEATRGLGEALVAGRAQPDSYTVRDGRIDGEGQTLTDEEVLRLASLARRIEARFGRPQDIEWCLDSSGEFQFVQARPITTLFPVPEAGDDGNHVYVSVGHQQMMTDAMKPLGISVWQLTAGRPTVTAGGRLFVDVTRDLGSPATREAIIASLGTSDPLIGDALRSVADRDGFVPSREDETPGGRPPAYARETPAGADPAIVAGLIERAEASLDALRRDIRNLSGTELLDFIRADIRDELKANIFGPENMRAIMAGLGATRWLNEHLAEWLGCKDAADTLARSAPGNVTSEMGLALLDVADVIRPHPEVVAFLEGAIDDGFIEKLPALDGGQQAREAIEAFLARYGMRCAGEIDITRPRWSENPAALVPLLLGNVRNFGAGAGRRRFEQGRREAREAERDLLARLRALPDGERKAEQATRMIDQVRAFIGYREYPKYHMTSRYFVYKKALLGEAGRLADAGVIGDREDIFYLTFGELADAVSANRADSGLVHSRMLAFGEYKGLTPPRVLTSDGEAVAGSYRRGGTPAGALTGLPVSAGTAEGRARVVPDLAGADLGPDDILVTAYTDPGWTPAFLAVKGLVTEVGGLMTHGAVVAREYGLPAVVGVERATALIRDGQLIRVDGTGGYVEILP